MIPAVFQEARITYDAIYDVYVPPKRPYMNSWIHWVSFVTAEDLVDYPGDVLEWAKRVKAYDKL